MVNELHVHATIDLDDLTADVARHVAGKERSDVGDVLHLTAAAQGYLLLPLVANLLRQGGCHGCLNEARCNGVGADTLR